MDVIRPYRDQLQDFFPTTHTSNARGVGGWGLGVCIGYLRTAYRALKISSFVV